MSRIKFSYRVPAIDGQAADIIAPLGSSIADMAAMLGASVQAAWIVDFDGQRVPVPRDLWARVKPKKDGVVFFDCRMGKKAFNIVAVAAAIAVAVIAPQLGPALAASLGFTGSIAAGIATAAVGFGLNTLTNILFASGGGGFAGGFAASPDAVRNNYASVDTDNNILGRDAYLPRVFGEARISPPDVIQPNAFVDRGAQAIERVLAISGYNTVHNVYIDGTPVIETVNLVPDANAFDFESDWTQSTAADVTPAQAAPDGSENACKLIANTTDLSEKIIGHALASLDKSDRVDFSVYAKAAEVEEIYIAISDAALATGTDACHAIVDLTDGSVVSAATEEGDAESHGLTVEDAGGGWWKITLSATLDAAGSGQVYLQVGQASGGAKSFAAALNDGFMLWNAVVPTTQNMPNVDMTVREGAPNETTVVPVQRITKPVATSGDVVGFTVDDQTLEDQETPENSSPTGYRFIIKSMPQATEMAVRMAIGGLADLKDTDNKVRIPLRMRYRPISDTEGAWINLPEIHFIGIELGRRMFEIRLRRELQGFVGEDVSGVISHKFWREVPAVTASTLADGSEGRVQWRANSIFATGSGLQDVKNCFSVRHGVRVIVPDDKFAAGQDYEFEIKRGCTILDGDINDSYEVDTEVVSLFVSRDEGGVWQTPVSQNNFQATLSILNAAMVRDGVHPVQKPGTTVLCLQSRNQSIRNVTAHVTGMAKDWDGSGWNSWIATRNPAIQARQLMEDLLRYARVAEYSSNPRIAALAQSALVNTDWLGWREQCEKMGATCSVVTAGQSVMEVFMDLLGAGLARPALGDKLRIDYFRDLSAETPVLTFSPRNSDSVTIIYENPRRPMGVRAKFRDRNRSWQEREIEVRAPIYGNVQNWDGATYENIDDENWLRQRVVFDMLRAHYWRTRYEVVTPLEGMALKPGTLVGLITDLVDDRSYGARVRDVLPDGRLVLDNVWPTVTEQLTMDDAGTAFTLDDLLTVYDQAYALLTTPTGAELRAVTAVDGNVITPATPFSSDDVIGAHIGIGDLSTRLKRCIVVEESASGEFSKTVTLADEAPQIYDHMKNTFGWSD